MTSRLAWLDTSPGEQKAAREVIAMFSDQESRDELGIGQIRDVLGNWKPSETDPEQQMLPNAELTWPAVAGPGVDCETPCRRHHMRRMTAPGGKSG